MKADVLIVGGGASGSATAFFLRLMDPGCKVVVVERDPTYEFASTPRASGGVRRLFSLPENIALSNFSIPFFEAFPRTMSTDDEDCDIAFRKNGYLFVVPPASINLLKQNFDTQQKHGVNVVWLDQAAIKARYPSMNVEDLGAAVFSPDDGWLDPYSVLQGFRRKAKDLGTEYVADEVVGIERDQTRVKSVRLKSGTYVQADHVVNAAGAWARDICAMVGVDAPIQPLRRYEHYFESAEPIEPIPYLKDLARLAFRPEGKGYSGGVPTLAEPRGYNFGVDHSYFDEVVWPALAHRFPQFERTRVKNTLPGLYDQNELDGNMVIGPGAGGLANFHMLAGFSGHGLMHTPGSGRALAELILTGRYQSIDLTRFGWERIEKGEALPERGII